MGVRTLAIAPLSLLPTASATSLKLAKRLITAAVRRPPVQAPPIQKRTPAFPQASRSMFLAKFSSLFLQHHLLGFAVATTAHPVKIHARRQFPAGAVATVPDETIVSGIAVIALKALKQLAAGVVDTYLHVAGIL